MTSLVLRAAMLLALGAGTVQAQLGPMTPMTPVAHEGRPDMRPERVALEAVGGTYAGLAGYFVGRSLGTVATMMMSAERERTRDQIVHGVGIVGGAFAIGGAVFAIGDMGSETGSFPVTMLGVGAGAGVGYAMSRMVFRGRIPTDGGSARRHWLVVTLESALPAIGGTIAFNATRKWQR